MAGIYADIPGTRFALDQDGSVLKSRNITTGSAWVDETGSLTQIQDDTNATSWLLNGGSQGDGQTHEVVVAFPEARGIDGIFAQYTSGGNGVTGVTWYYSNDTTDGTDGVWNTFTGASFYQSSGTPKPYYRSNIGLVALTNVRGVRVRVSHDFSSVNANRYYCIHIYGSRPTASVDRLAFWDPSTDQAAAPAYLDFGDHAQGTITTRQFRVKNLSATLTANTVTVDVSDLATNYGSNLEVSTDNTNYFNSINIGNLAPGTISSSLYVRRTVPGAETTTQRLARLLANAASWS